MFRGFDLIKQMGESKSVIGRNMLRLWDDRGTLRAVDRAAVGRARRRTVAPVVHAAVPLHQAPEAHRIIAGRMNVGKVVLVP